jgi:hypothetical protein
MLLAYAFCEVFLLCAQLPSFHTFEQYVKWGRTSVLNCFALLKGAIDWEIFLHCASLCSFHFNCSSIMTPITFLLETCCIIWLPITIEDYLNVVVVSVLSLPACIQFFPDSMLICWHLAMNHLCTLSNSVLILFSISVDNLPWQDKFVSSVCLYRSFVCIVRSLVSLVRLYHM